MTQKFDSDYSRSMSDSDFMLERDDPEKRASALRYLINNGAQDLAEMIGVNNPIPSYGAQI